LIIFVTSPDEQKGRELKIWRARPVIIIFVVCEFPRYAARRSGQAGAAYGAMQRAGKSYHGFLSRLVLVRKMLWGNKK
jgi:hypothetical protein